MKKSEVLKHIYSKIKDIEGITGIFTEWAPETSKMPYIILSGLYEKEGRLISCKEKMITVEITIWDYEKSYKKLQELSELVAKKLNDDFEIQSKYIFKDIANEGILKSVLKYGVYVDDK